MARWKRRLITEAAIGLLLIALYLQMTRSGWPQHTILIALGGFGIACGVGGFVIKPNEKFAELTGHYRGGARIAYAIGWVVLGSALLAWAFLVNRTP